MPALIVIDYIALILLIIGGINLGIVGLFNYDPIIDLSGDMVVVAHSIFFLMGLAAIYVIFRLRYLLDLLRQNP